MKNIQIHLKYVYAYVLLKLLQKVSALQIETGISQVI